MTKGFIKGMLVGAGTALLALTAGILISGCALSTSPSGKAFKEYVENSEKIAAEIDNPPTVTPGQSVLVGDENGNTGVSGDSSTYIAGSVNSKEEWPVTQEFVSKLQTLEFLIENYFYFDFESDDLREKALQGFVSGLGDKYSEYITKTEYEVLKGDTAGEFYGIGASFSQNAVSMLITVESVNKGSAAEEVGIKAGDILVAVDGQSVANALLNDVVRNIRGDEDTNVNLRFFRALDENGEGQYLDFVVTRRRVEIVSVTPSTLEDADRDYGYIQISTFDGRTLDQFKAAIDEFTSKNYDGVIIDLRGNGGGLFQTAISMADYILEDGLLITYTDSLVTENEIYYSSDGHKTDIPLVVLIDGNSASSSEVFAGALADHKRAFICGGKSFGKGIVQCVWDLADGSALKLTTASYYTPNGVCIHGTGISPNLISEDDPQTDADEVLEDALLILPILIEEGMEGLE